MKYELNNIYNEDSYKAIKDIPDNTFDLIQIDPPYEYTSATGGGAFGNKNRDYHLEYKEISFNKHVNSKDRVWKGKKANSSEIKNMSSGFNYEILDEFDRVMKKTNIYIWCSKHQLSYLLNYYIDKGCNIEVLTWHKTNAIPTANNTYMNDTEYIVFAREKGVKIYGTVKTKMKYYVTSVNRKDKELYKHPTIKPLHILKNFIINSTKPGDLCGDFFMGVASFPVACQETGRNYIGFELDKRFFNIGKDRINGITANGQTSIFTVQDKFDFFGDD